LELELDEDSDELLEDDEERLGSFFLGRGSEELAPPIDPGEEGASRTFILRPLGTGLFEHRSSSNVAAYGMGFLVRSPLCTV